jgi:hypothetical protein
MVIVDGSVRINVVSPTVPPISKYKILLHPSNSLSNSRESKQSIWNATVRASSVFWIATGRAENVRSPFAKRTCNVGQQTLI